jgi:hypothetical protein
MADDPDRVAAVRVLLPLTQAGVSTQDRLPPVIREF